MDDIETVETSDEQQQETGKGLRAQLESVLAENKKLKAEKMESSFEAIGLDPNIGLGKAIAKEYNGEVSTDALAQYAADEYGYTPPIQMDNPLSDEIANQQARLDEVGQTAGSVSTPSRNEVLAKAEAEGDYRTTLGIKGAEVASWFDRRP